FTSIGGQARAGLAALSPTTGAANGWNPGASNIYGMSSDGTTLYVFGDFTSAGVGAPLRQRIAGIDMTTGNATSFDLEASSPTGFQGDIIFANSKVYVAATGSTTSAITIGGQTRYLAELDPATGLATSFNPYDGAYFQWLGVPFLLDGTKLYAGGD